MDRDPRENPQVGDRWRTPWGTSTVEWVGPDAIEVGGETMTREDWLFAARRGGWTFLEGTR